MQTTEEQEKSTYSFNLNDTDFTNLKKSTIEFYQPYGFDNVVVDNAENWMLKKKKKDNSYILVSKQKDKCILELYNAPTFDKRKQILKNISENEYYSREVKNLEKQLDNLLDLTKKEGIAISFQGSWGIGKTFFWNHYITNKYGPTKFINISLFGVNTLKEIKNKIVLKIYDSNKINNFLENNPVVGKVIEKKFGINPSLIANNLKKDDFENVVICFDDFERISSNLSLSEILGFISELKEQHKCKVVLINNNNMLKVQDELNHKKHLRKNNDGKVVERFFTTQTNNHEIFDKYMEKIIDVTLKYEPHLKDSIQFLKEKNHHKSYIDWELLEKLFSTLTDENKRLNIRLMKQVIIKLEFLEEILILEDLDTAFKNGILIEIFNGIINERVNLVNLNIETIFPYSLKKPMEQIIQKHSADLEFFQSEIKNYNLSVKRDKFNSELRKNIDDIYSKYLYDMTYDNNTFIQELFDLLNTENVDIVEVVSLSSFEFYIKSFLMVLDENDDKYTEFFIKKAKVYIKNHINTLSNIDIFTRNGLDNSKALQTYYDSLKSQLSQDKTNTKEKVIETITTLLEKRGWNSEIENLLSNIDISKHKEWMISDRDYFELIFNFIDWINNFSGDKPFGDMYKNTMMIYAELSEIKEYKHKMKFVLDRFPLTSNLIHRLFLEIPEKERYEKLRKTAKDWASKNLKKYNESESNPINKFHTGFLYHLTNIKPNSYYQTIEIAMTDYFREPTGTGINFFKRI